MWYPGFETRYNHGLSTRYPRALAQEEINQIPLALLHPGILAFYGDAVTPSLLIRPRLQTHAVKNPVTFNTVIER